MKRFYVTAAIAASLLATGCQKTYVIDEVRTPIGFSTEVGKQTKVIVDNSKPYPDNQPFGVFAYGVQGENAPGEWSSIDDLSKASNVMSNVKITKIGEVWKALSSYYWPNDSKTTLSFFAYAPYSDALGCTVGFTAADGISLTGYTHSKYTGTDAVDFMVADGDAMKNMQYTSGEGGNNGVVPTVFIHKMAQVCFVIKTDQDYGATFTLNSLKLKKIKDKAKFTANSGWTEHSVTNGESDKKGEFPINNSGSAAINTSGITLDPVTMIPQTLSAGNQQFEIVYTINGTGFASETVTRTFDITTDSVNEWTKNMKVTYTLTVKMNEITFNPSVENWTDVSGSIDIVQ